MPNIMICGFGFTEVKELKDTIDAAMQALNLGGAAITSVVEMETNSCDGKRTRMPYLRICSTNEEEIQRIIKTLQIIGYRVDVEWLVLDGFISADDMRKASTNTPSRSQGI